MGSNPKNTRRCIVCRQHADKTDMIRFVENDQGEIIIDVSQKANGRGAWVHDSGECVSKLIKKKMLNTVFKRNVGDGIYGELNDR